MNDQEKKDRKLAAEKHIAHVQHHINAALVHNGEKEQKMRSDLKHLGGADRIVQTTLHAYTKQQVEQLAQLFPSPYFSKLKFETTGITRDIYIGKFSFVDEGIYSWVTPIASLRFESPGNASYKRPNGSERSGTLKQKDQLVITNGKVVFYATEEIDKPRELIYQEHFTRTKKGFVLQEVVEKMEKAQDTIIRAPHKGPFVIAGPAGSGKTTLALHRTAYLLQSPETASEFPPEKLLVLVQDEGTKAYFSALLPDLGIKGIDIQTFSSWANSIMELRDMRFVLETAPAGVHKDVYAHQKLQALRNGFTGEFTRSVFPLLKKIYAEHFSAESLKAFDTQRKSRTLDRIDLTILLTLYKQKFGELSYKKEYFQERADGLYNKKIGTFPANYNLLIIDEFQNYLPEQLRLLNSCMNDRIDSVMYIGDLKQQTLLGTISEWDQLDRRIAPERMVQLEKVYRNTKEILQYIQSVGYDVTIPDVLPDGEAVQEKLTVKETLEQVKKVVNSHTEGSIGILAHTAKELTEYKVAFVDHERVHCLTFQETQGVEFETVCMVGIREDVFLFDTLPEAIQKEKQEMERDLLYVALTRAMNELYVFGSCPLKKAAEPLF